MSLIANISVIVGIAFLAYEINQNTDAIQSQTRASIFAGAQEELWKNMEYPDVTINLGSHDRELTADEKIRLDAWLTAALRAREFAWLEYENGNLDVDQWAAEQEVIRVILGSIRTRKWWSEIARPTFPERFASIVDELVLDRPAGDFVDKVLSIE